MIGTTYFSFFCFFYSTHVLVIYKRVEIQNGIFNNSKKRRETPCNTHPES